MQCIYIYFPIFVYSRKWVLQTYDRHDLDICYVACRYMYTLLWHTRYEIIVELYIIIIYIVISTVCFRHQLYIVKPVFTKFLFPTEWKKNYDKCFHVLCSYVYWFVEHFLTSVRLNFLFTSALRKLLKLFSPSWFLFYFVARFVY